MPTLKLELSLSIDGVPVKGFDPVIRKLSVDESVTFVTEKANDGDATTFSTLPVAELDTIKFLALRPSKQITLRLDGQSNAGIVLDADSLMVVLGATIDASASTNALVNNNSGAISKLEGLGAGT